MKKFLPKVLLIAFLQLTHGQQTMDRICNGRMDGFLFHDPTSCHMFVECERGQALRRTCPSGTLFNLDLFYCTAAHTVTCGDRHNPHAGEEHVEQRVRPPANGGHHSVCSQQNNGELLENPGSCRAFIECQDGFRLDRECARGELFESSSRRCLSDFAVNCGNRPIVGENDERELQNVCRGVSARTLVPHPSECQIYFECQNGRPISHTCPPGLLFDTSSRTCNYEFNVMCGTRRNSESPLQRNRVQNDITTPCSERSGTYISPHPLPCQSTYFICIDGNMMQHSCGNGIFFNPRTLQCDFADNVGCTQQSSSIVMPHPLIPRTNVCANGERFSSHLTDCTRYYICVNNQPQQMNCPRGEIWNSKEEKCEVPTANSQCHGRMNF